MPGHWKVELEGLCFSYLSPNNMFVYVFINTGPGGGFTPQNLLKLILNEKVPSILGLVAITGLPESQKSNVLRELMAHSIRLKQEKKHLLAEYLKRGRNPMGLSAYELPIIGNGSNYHAWFLAYKRCSVTFFALSALLQKRGLCSKLDLAFDEDTNGDPILPSEVLDSQLK